jgi:hypothetical protein
MVRLLIPAQKARGWPLGNSSGDLSSKQSTCRPLISGQKTLLGFVDKTDNKPIF